MAKTAEERLQAEEKISEAAKERIKLVEMERQENEKLLEIQLRRQQAQHLTDPIRRAELALEHAQGLAQRTRLRSDASASEKAAADYQAEEARRNLLDVVAEEAPSLQEIAATGSGSRERLSRAANRSSLNDAARAQQAAALRERARALRAGSPYKSSARSAADRMEARADRLEAQASDLMDDTPTAENREEFEGASKERRQELLREARLSKEQATRKNDHDRAVRRWEQSNPLDAKLKREGRAYDSSQEPSMEQDVPASAEMPGGGDQKGDPMGGIGGVLASIDATTKAIDAKLPVRALK